MKPTKALRSVAYHEAGHAVAAWEVSLPIKTLSIVPEADTAGRLVHPPYFKGVHPDADTSPCVQRRIENMVFVCYAGPEAERRFNPKGLWKDHAQGDWKQAIEILTHQVGSDEELEAYCNLMRIRAKNFIALDHVWEDIEKLADELLVRQKMSGRDVDAVLQGKSHNAD